MNYTLKCISLSLVLFAITQYALAQSYRIDNDTAVSNTTIAPGQKTNSIQEATLNIDAMTSDNYMTKSATRKVMWQRCYDLADAYMDIADTSMALVYYQKGIYLDTANNARRLEFEQLKKYYMEPARSFYLKVN